MQAYFFTQNAVDSMLFLAAVLLEHLLKFQVLFNVRIHEIDYFILKQ